MHDDALSRLLKVRAPLASRRLSTLNELYAAGIPTYAPTSEPATRLHLRLIRSLSTPVGTSISSAIRL